MAEFHVDAVSFNHDVLHDDGSLRRQIRRLDGAVARSRAVFVTGPAGYGKSAVVRRWFDSLAPGRQVYVEVEADQEAIVEAFATAVAGGRPVSWADARRTDDEGSLDEAARATISGLLDDDAPPLVVLDLAGPGNAAPVLADLVTTVLNRPEPQVQLVIASRARPSRRLAAAQLQGSVGHLDETDLRLTPDEVEVVLSRGPDPDLVARVLEVTEGWPAAVRFIATSVARPGAADVDRVARGVDRALDYLTAEVLDALSDEQRELVALAALFDEVHPDLLDHLLDGTPTRNRLWELRALSCFVEPIEDGTWLRFHPLAKEAATRAAPRPASGRERARAAAWFVQRERPIAAITCLLAIEDWDRADQVMTAHLTRLLSANHFEEFVQFCGRLPPSVLDQNARWSVGVAAIEIMTDRPREALDRLAAVEAHLVPQQLVISKLLRTSMAPFFADVEPALAAAREGLDLCDRIGDDTPFDHGFVLSRTEHFRAQLQATALVACTYGGLWERGTDHEVTVGTSSTTETEMAPIAQFLVLRSHAASDALAGRLVTAQRLVDQERQLRREHPELYVVDPAQIQVIDAEILRSQGAWQRATEVLDSIAPHHLPSPRLNTEAWRLSLRAHLAVDAADAGRALELADAAPELLGTRPAVLFQATLATAAARAHLALDRPAEAEAVLAEAPPQSLVWWWRVLAALAISETTHARRLLASWPADPSLNGRVHRLMATALVAEGAASRREVESSVVQALALAERHQLLRPFIDAGPRGLTLLQRYGASSFIARQAMKAQTRLPTAPGDGRFTPSESLVLAHLADDATLAQIADRLHLSVNTVKSHVQKIYRKLDVTSRAEAVQSWRQIDQRAEVPQLKG